MLPANENFFYRLATAYGEQPSQATHWTYDRELAENNRRVWNRWWWEKLQLGAPPYFSTEYLDNDQKSSIVKDFPTDDQHPLNDEDKTALESRLDSMPEPSLRGGIAFENLIFNQAVIFTNYIFLLQTSFNGSSIEADIKFDKSHFVSNAKFSVTKFHKKAIYKESVFVGDLDATGATFMQKALFEKAALNASAYFDNSTFHEDVNFQETAFGHSTFFRTVKFAQGVDFHNAVFCNPIYFNKTNFAQGANFSADSIQKNRNLNANFRLVTYAEQLDIKGRIFSDITQLNDLKVGTGVRLPDSFHSWPLIGKRSDLKKRVSDQLKIVSPLARKEKKQFIKVYKENRISQEFDAYAKLQSQMDVDRRENMRIIFRLREYYGRLHCWKGSYIDHFLILLYWIFSGFGYGVIRPLSWLFVLYGLSFCLHLELVYPAPNHKCNVVECLLKGAVIGNLEQKTHIEGYEDSVARSRKAALSGFTLIGAGPNYEQMTLLQFSILGLQRILSIFFVFLLGLGIRTRLKLNA